MAEKLNRIPVDSALEAARNGILEHKPFLHERAEEYMSSGHASNAILVQRLDAVGTESYYLISWTFDGLTVAIIQVDALNGSFLGASVLAKPKKSPFLSLEDALKQAILEDSNREYGVPRYVWYPCRESTTPTYPFCEVPYDNGVVYVTMSGEVLSELTPLGRGG